MKFIRVAGLTKKKVLLRASLDAPVSTATGLVEDAFRLEAAVRSIKFLLQSENQVVLCGKRGRPEGKPHNDLSLAPVAEHLAGLLDLRFVSLEHLLNPIPERSLIFLKADIRQQSVREALLYFPVSSVLCLENLEFYPEELDSSTAFAKQLSSLADVYVNDDFSKCHHKAASINEITKFLPSFVGLQLEKEVVELKRILERPKSPFVVLMGGIKITDKTKILQNLGKRADMILLAGGLANLLFLSRGYEIGQSKAEMEAVSLAFQIDKNFKGKLYLPDDVVVASDSMDKTTIRVCAPHEVKKQECILDAGPKTILRYAGLLKRASTIVWNGPLGHFEKKPFDTATLALAKVVGAVSGGRCFTVVGGGETVDAVRQSGQAEYIDHLSTGGGAMLDFLAGDILPGLRALE